MPLIVFRICSQCWSWLLSLSGKSNLLDYCKRLLEMSERLEMVESLPESWRVPAFYPGNHESIQCRSDVQSIISSWTGSVREYILLEISDVIRNPICPQFLSTLIGPGDQKMDGHSGRPWLRLERYCSRIWWKADRRAVPPGDRDIGAITDSTGPAERW